jgi:hypothetical protein
MSSDGQNLMRRSFPQTVTATTRRRTLRRKTLARRSMMMVAAR